MTTPRALALELAIEAYRKAETARHAFARAELERNLRVGRVTPEDLPEYWHETEVIRLQADRAQALRHQDRDAADWCTRRIEEMNIAWRNRAAEASSLQSGRVPHAESFGDEAASNA